MWTIHEAAAALRAGRLTPVDLLEECLARIDRLEPTIRAWVLVDKEGARADAQRLTDELARGQDRGPLHGIPIGIKDIFDVFDWPTAAGSKLWANSIARQDAVVVKRLRQAGAVFVGKTVTTQYASFDPPPTRNPYNPERTPGGSSSGSAAAVATGMCLGALGSQTGGSITRPASYCGVAGCKPSYGLVSCEGVVPLAHSMDHPGPMARCVRDLTLMLPVLMEPEWGVKFISKALSDPPKPPHLARLRGLFDQKAEPSVTRLMDTVTDKLTASGAEVEDVEPPPVFHDILTHHRVVMAVEAASFHEPRLRRHSEDYGPNITALLREGIDCSALAYERAKQLQGEARKELAKLTRCFDGLLCPATTGPAPDARTTGDPAFNSPWSFTGLPVVSFPVAMSSGGLPLAVQIAGAILFEERLLKAAAWCEALFAGQVSPP